MMLFQMFKSRAIILTIILNVYFVGYSQTGPGGVGANTTNVFWLDAHSLDLANGTAVASWTDQSGNSNHAIQSTPGAMPTITSNAINGRDVVNFNGSQFLTAGANANLNNKNFINFYMVGNIDNLNLLSIPMNLDYGTTAENAAFCGFLSQSGVFNSYARKSPATLIKTAFSPSSGYHMFEGVYNKGINQLNSQTDFNLSNVNNTVLKSSGTHQEIWIGGTNSFGINHYYMDGQIAELFIFTAALSVCEEKILQNYINAKYGITISNDMYSLDGTHGLCVIGIGQESLSDTHTSSQGNGVVLINNATNLENGEYLFTGHDDVSLSNFSSDVPVGILNGQRFERTWRVAKTGNVGNVDITFDLDPSTDFSSNNPSEYRLLVDSDGIFAISDQSITGIYNAGTNSITFTNVDLSDGDFFTLAGQAPVEIHSITDGMWSNPNTWDCTCVPSLLNNVFIDPGHNITVDIDANCRSLEVNATSSLSLMNGMTLSINENFNLFGNFTSNQGTVSFEGSSAQFFDDGGNGTTFYNLTINNNDPSGVTFFASDIIIDGTLSVDQGLFDISDSGMNFIINSTNSGTEGRINTLSPGCSINGQIKVRRFIDSGNSDWRDICSPVIGSTFLDWDPDLAMSGPSFPDGCASGNGEACFKSVRYTVANSQVEVLNASDVIVNGRGYSVWMGDDLVSFSGTTLTSVGTVNTSSDIVKTLGPGWYTIGNPYVSPILFSLVTKQSPIGDYFYVYDQSIGDYQWYDGSSGLGSIPELDNGLMAIGQGIWVFANSTANLTFHQTDKTGQNATYIRSTELEAANKTLTLKLIQEGTTYQTSVMFEMNPLASDGLDSLADMRYLENGFEASPRLYMNLENELVRKNFVANDFKNKSFELQSKFKKAGYYAFSLENVAVANDYRSVLLYDNLTNEFIDLKIENNYTFYSDIYEGQRFTLIFTNELIEASSSVASLTSSEINGNIELIQMSNTFNLKINQMLSGSCIVNVYDILGQRSVYMINLSVNEGANLFTLPADLHGVHIISIEYGNELITKKVVL